jgi:deoxyribodipyrimidine photo-lyase
MIKVIYDPGFLKTGQGKPFSVFTPFKRRWVENFDMNFLELESPSKKLENNSSIQTDLSCLKFVKTHSANIDLWPAGESAAQEKLKNFLQSKAQFYNRIKKFSNIRWNKQNFPIPSPWYPFS